MSDFLEEAWWVFELPGGTLAHVPAISEVGARKALVALCYKDAPVHDWPFVASRWTTREALIKSLLGRPVLPGLGAGEEPGR